MTNKVNYIPTSRSFKCAVCGEIVPLEELSEWSLEVAGTRSKRIALARLDPNELTCSGCIDELTPDENEVPHLFAGRYDSFQLSRVEVEWLQLNY